MNQTSFPMDDAYLLDEAVIAIALDHTGAGDRVRIESGPLQGVEGIVVRQQADDRYLLKLYDGVFVETSLVRPDAVGPAPLNSLESR
jgi:hypothetical protein